MGNCGASRKTSIVKKITLTYTSYKEKDVMDLEDFSVRQKNILLELAEEKGKVKGTQLAQSLNISLRTLQSEVQNINRIAAKKLIVSDNQGYSLHDDHQNTLPFITNEHKQEKSYQPLLKKLIVEDGKHLIDDLADELYVSTSTLQQQLVQLQTILSSYQLHLKRLKNYIWIEGCELDKRRMIRHLIYQEVEPIFINMESCASYFEDMDILRIRDIILQAIHHYNCYVEDCYATNLMINITIALYRIRQGFTIESTQEDNVIEKSFIEYNIAKEICDHYANHWSLPFQEQDIRYIAMLIMGQIKPEMLHQRLGRTTNSIDDTFKEKVKDILLKTFNYYMLHIDYNTFLYNFVLHVDALIKRANTHQHASNAIVDNIKANCPFIYDVAVYLAKEIEDTFHIKVTDEEIGFISIHIGFVIENSTKDTDKIRVLLLCNEYHHILDTILDKLKDNYAQTIEITNVVTNFKQDAVESSADLIISTLPIRIIGKKVVMITPFYTMMDHLKVDQAINECLQEQTKRRDQQLLLTYFHEKLFFKRHDLKKKEEVIQFLGEEVIHFGLAEDGFIESVLKREQMSSTCFFETFAIPHALELNAKKTMFCVLVNEEGIQWDDHIIPLVFMIAVQQKDRKTFMKIYNGIIQTLCRKEKVYQLVQADTLMDFIECFKN